MDVPARPARAPGLTLELVRLAGPIVGLNLSYALLGVTDTLFMGRLGPTQVAAAGLGNLVYITFFLLLRGTVNGIVPFASRAWGAGDLAECGRHLRGFLWLALILSFGVLVLRPLFVPIFTLIGPAPAVLSGAVAFAQIRALEIPFALVSTALLSFRVSVSDSRTPMLITWGGVLANVLLNWLLVFGTLGFPALGLRGSAVGTVIAVALQAVAAVLIVLPARELRRFSLAFAWPSLAELRRLARVGLPMGLTEFAEVGSFSAFFGLLARLGTFELAASQIANQIASAAFMAGFALATATASLVGRKLGAGDPRAATRVGYTGVVLGMVFMGAVGLAFLVLADPLISSFTAVPEVRALGVGLLHVMAGYQVLDAVGIIFRGALTGAGDTRFAFVFTVLGGWGVMVPVAYLLGFTLGWGMIGAWGGPIIYLSLAAAVFGWRFRSGVWAASQL